MLTLQITVQEAQTILNALVKEPYISVVNVINKIQTQTSEQISKNKESE